MKNVIYQSMIMIRMSAIMSAGLGVLFAGNWVGAVAPANTNAPGMTQSIPDGDISKSEQGAWLFAYFRQRYDSRVEIDAEGHVHAVPLPNPMREEELHFALSTDGRHWSALNDNRPVWNQRLRDPFIQRGPDGLWHLVATGGHPLNHSNDVAGPVCLYADSRDLITWEHVRSLPLMKGVHDETGRAARNIWAPEWFLDPNTGDYFLLWSSSFEDQGWKKSRLWCARTRDWQIFTPAKTLFRPSYSAIDGTLWEHGGKYYLFHKEEEFGAATGERRAIRLATSGDLEGPYKIYHGPLNDGQIAPVITEGPSVMPDPQHAGWLLMYDYCMSDGYGISSSPDLLNWKIEKSAVFPPDARHGCFLQLSPGEVRQLRAAFPEGK